MPDPSDFDNRDGFMEACIPEVIGDGTVDTDKPEDEQRDQAVAVCSSMWEESLKNNRDLHRAHPCQAGGSCECGGTCACETMQRHASPVFNVDEAQVRTETLGGREYRVAPVVAAVGNKVMNNALVPLEELQKSLPSWNGRPLPVNHPELHGQPISANSPQILENTSVGQFFNAEIDAEGRFKGELWIDTERANAISPTVMERLEEGQLEVSTAYFAMDENAQGNVNGEPYGVIHRQLLPDHLALLPNERGACSWEDGCGAPRVNEEESMSEGQDEKDMKTQVKEWFSRVFGNARHEQKTNEEDTHSLESELMFAIEEELKEPVFVETVFFESNQVVYEVLADDQFKLQMRSYSRGDDGSISLGDDVQDMERVVSFQPVSNESGDQTPAAEPSEVQGMSDKETRIGELIDNSATPFTEDDRETLRAFSDEKIEALAGNGETVDGNADGGDGDGDAPAANADQTVETFIEQAPAGIRDSLQTMHEDHQAKRKELVGTITANEANAFTEDELHEMDTNRLKKLAAFARKPSYEGRGAPDRDADLSANADDEAYQAPSLSQRLSSRKAG